LVVESHDDAELGVEHGSVGVDHMHRSQLSAMSEGDGVVCYSPPRRSPDGGVDPRGFTVLGAVKQAPPYLAEGALAQAVRTPYRRDIDVLAARFVRLDDVALQLKMTRDSRKIPAANAGVKPFDLEDYALLAELMSQSG
jgi:hypothetical protein